MKPEAQHWQQYIQSLIDRRQEIVKKANLPTTSHRDAHDLLCAVPGYDFAISHALEYRNAADMFETTSALIGKVTEVENGWEVAFAPDCTTWITVRRDEHDEPKVGDFITVTVPKAVAIHSQPNTPDEPRKSAPSGVLKGGGE